MTWRSTAHIPKTPHEAYLLEGFVQTDDMRAADQEVRNSTPETEPENWTFYGSSGWQYTGPRVQDTTASKVTSYKNSKLNVPNPNGGLSNHEKRRVHLTGSHGWHRGGDFLELAKDGNGVGYGGYTPESWKRFRDAGGKAGHPLIDTSPHDLQAIQDMYRSDTYNPYVDRSRHDEAVRKGSVADVLYGLMKGDLANRGKVWKAVRNTNDLGNKQMTSQFWNDSGLNEILGSYEDRVGNAGSKADWIMNGNGMMSGLNNLPKIQNNGQRRERGPVWGNGMLSEDSNTMRQALVENLEKKLLG